MIEWSKLPPLAMLRAFGAYGETGNVTKAGARLNVSHAAISQHIRALERHIGCTLLDRSGRQARLTEDGARLAEALARGFGTIAQVIEELTGEDAGRALIVSATPTIASAWLLPRLPDFRARHPDIDLMIDATAQVRTIAPGEVDVALRYGSGDWPGLEAELLILSPVVVVGAPSLVGVDGSDGIEGKPWLQELGTTEASDFLQGAAVVKGAGTTSLPGNMMLEAARAGQGLAAVARIFVEADIDAGRLVEMDRDSRQKGYYMVSRPGVHRPTLKQFMSWLRQQAKSTRETGG